MSRAADKALVGAKWMSVAGAALGAVIGVLAFVASGGTSLALGLIVGATIAGGIKGAVTGGLLGGLYGALTDEKKPSSHEAASRTISAQPMNVEFPQTQELSATHFRDVVTQSRNSPSADVIR